MYLCHIDPISSQKVSLPCGNCSCTFYSAFSNHFPVMPPLPRVVNHRVGHMSPAIITVTLPVYVWRQLSKQSVISSKHRLAQRAREMAVFLLLLFCSSKMYADALGGRGARVASLLSPQSQPSAYLRRWRLATLPSSFLGPVAWRGVSVSLAAAPVPSELGWPDLSAARLTARRLQST